MYSVFLFELKKGIKQQTTTNSKGLYNKWNSHLMFLNLFPSFNVQFQ
jgi:hypothetical protein